MKQGRLLTPQAIAATEAGSASVQAFGLSEADEDTRAVWLDMQRWLQVAVIGLNLCPFAKAVQAKGLIHWHISSARRPKEVLKELQVAMTELNAMSPDVRDTSLLVLPHALQDFLAFNDLLDEADALLHEMGLQGIIQIASFHPDYLFADEPPDDAAHCSNRAPYPTLHLLREDSLSRAIDAMDDPGSIYLHNIQRLRALGWSGWRELDVGTGGGSRHLAQRDALQVKDGT